MCTLGGYYLCIVITCTTALVLSTTNMHLRSGHYCTCISTWKQPVWWQASDSMFKVSALSYSDQLAGTPFWITPQLSGHTWSNLSAGLSCRPINGQCLFTWFTLVTVDATQSPLLRLWVFSKEPVQYIHRSNEYLILFYTHTRVDHMTPDSPDIVLQSRYLPPR